ncbi:MAG: Arm DNA-binding domain-containing protein [Candidatus Thiodiazotropha endolucinida]
MDYPAVKAPGVLQHHQGNRSSNKGAEMAKANLLSAAFCRNVNKKGMHADGNGLFLRVSPSGSKSWVFRYRWKGKRPEIGLGAYSNVPLAEAREKMADCRKLIRKGIDPRHQTKVNDDNENIPSFRECSESFIKDKRSEWKNVKHVEQWKSTLATYAYPIIGDLPVNQVDLEEILKILSPIWEVKTETASRLRGRIERVLSWAKVKKYREDPTAVPQFGINEKA